MATQCNCSTYFHVNINMFETNFVDVIRSVVDFHCLVSTRSRSRPRLVTWASLDRLSKRWSYRRVTFLSSIKRTCPSIVDLGGNAIEWIRCFFRLVCRWVMEKKWTGELNTLWTYEYSNVALSIWQNQSSLSFERLSISLTWRNKTTRMTVV
jgi:hypothetical protein